MVKKHFSYSMELLFDQPVHGHAWSLKCIPQSDMRQEILSLSIDITPKQPYSYSWDQFGNVVLYGTCEEEHDRFSVRLEGFANTGRTTYSSEGNYADTVIFRNPSALTCPGETLKSFYQSLPLEDHMPDYEKASLIRRKVHEAVRYVCGSTGISTTAEEALKQGTGVCQDYAHIMIALCRMAKIPARYAVGLMDGEGVSHAWVEVFCDGFWYGQDPTNNCMVYDWYVKLTHGRDYNDCLVNKGKFYGGGRQTQQIRVIVEDAR